MRGTCLRGFELVSGFDMQLGKIDSNLVLADEEFSRGADGQAVVRWPGDMSRGKSEADRYLEFFQLAFDYFLKRVVLSAWLNTIQHLAKYDSTNIFEFS